MICIQLVRFVKVGIKLEIVKPRQHLPARAAMIEDYGAVFGQAILRHEKLRVNQQAVRRAKRNQLRFHQVVGRKFGWNGRTAKRERDAAMHDESGRRILVACIDVCDRAGC